MSVKDLRPRTKEFALRVIRMYSKLPKGDTVAQMLGNRPHFVRGCELLAF